MTSLTRHRWWSLLAVLMLALPLASAGCGNPKRDRGKRRERAAARRSEATGTPLQVAIQRGVFSVDEANGQRAMEARPESTEGLVNTGGSASGPVTFTRVSCKLFKNGRPDLDLVAPKAVWKDEALTTDSGADVVSADGTWKAHAKRAVWKDQVLRMFEVTATLFKQGRPDVNLSAPEVYTRENQLVADKTAHAESPDRVARMDARIAVWTRTTAHLHLEQAVGQKWEGGKQTFDAEGSRAEYQNDVLTLPAGGRGRRLDNGSTVRADRVRWHRTSGKLEADGRVQLDTPEHRIVGARFVGNTTLENGRFSGRPRPRVYLKQPPG